MPFVFRSFTWRDWARWTERHGLPIIILKTPVEAKKEATDRFLRSLRNIGAEPYIEAPQAANGGVSWGAELMEAKDTAHAGFERLLERIDTCIAVHLLGQNLTTEVQAGAYASSQVHKLIEGTILSSDAESLSTALREQVWKPWAKYNYGDADLAPWGTWDTAPPEDRAVAAATLKTAGEALAVWATTLKVPVDLKTEAERFGVAIRAGAPMPEPEADEPESEPEPKPPEAAKLSLAAAPSAGSGLVNGQEYIDAVANRAAARARVALAPDVAAILGAVDGATTYDDVKARILAAFGDMSPKKLAAQIEKAMILSGVAGRAAVLEDL